MLTTDGCKARRQRLWDQLAEKPDRILITDPSHLMYFANYFQTPFLFRSIDASAALILGRDGQAILVADNLCDIYAEQAVVDEVVAPVWYRCVESAPQRHELLANAVKDRLQTCAGRRFGVELSSVPAAVVHAVSDVHPKPQFIDIDPVVRRLRRSKDDDELALIRRSAAAAEAGFDAALRNFRPDMTELDAFFLVQHAALGALGEQAQIYGDFVSGPRCQQVGGPPSHRKIEKGDLFLLDFSVVVRGYRADFCNTFVVGAEPTAEERRLHQACLNAMAAGESALKAGQSGKQVYAAVRDCFAADGLAQRFPHHAGHGVGLGHPEPPFLVPESSETLLAGDIVTLEPGIYIPGVAGMRFERNYRIAETGFEVLTKHQLTLDQTPA